MKAGRTFLVLTGKTLLFSVFLLILYLGYLFFRKDFFWEPFWVNRLLLIVLLIGALYLLTLIGFFFLRLILSRWQPLRIFISYKHLYEEDARKLKEKLEFNGLVGDYLEFVQEVEHDRVVNEVIQKIRKADGMVVIPDAQQSSFVDAEIMTASSHKKPVVILKHSEGQKLPDTAYSGYPVFNLEALEKEAFIPLVNYFQYAGNTVGNAMREFEFISSSVEDGMSWDRIRQGAFAGFGIGGLLGWLAGSPGSFVYDVLSYIFGPIGSLWRAAGGLLGGAIVVGIGTLGFMGRMLFNWINRWKTLRIARQTILTGETTPQFLVRAFSGLYPDVLTTLERQPLIRSGK